MNDLVLATISSGLLSTIIVKVIDSINNVRQKDNETKKALMVLLGWQIREACKNALKSKQITMSELKQLEEMNKMYHSMGGNGFVKILIEKVERLEVIED